MGGPGSTDPVTRHFAEGEAALVLVESLLLLLIEKGALTSDEAVEAVQVAVGVKRQRAADGTEPELSAVGAGILSRIGNSLSAVAVAPPGKGQEG